MKDECEANDNNCTEPYASLSRQDLEDKFNDVEDMVNSRFKECYEQLNYLQGRINNLDQRLSKFDRITKLIFNAELDELRNLREDAGLNQQGLGRL